MYYMGSRKKRITFLAVMSAKGGGALSANKMYFFLKKAYHVLKCKNMQINFSGGLLKLWTNSCYFLHNRFLSFINIILFRSFSCQQHIFVYMKILFFFIYIWKEMGGTPFSFLLQYQYYNYYINYICTRIAIGFIPYIIPMLDALDRPVSEIM